MWKEEITVAIMNLTLKFVSKTCMNVVVLEYNLSCSKLYCRRSIFISGREGRLFMIMGVLGDFWYTSVGW